MINFCGILSMCGVLTVLAFYNTKENKKLYEIGIVIILMLQWFRVYKWLVKGPKVWK